MITATTQVDRSHQHEEFLSAIEQYAKAYGRLEKFQKDENHRHLVPLHADQKTGMIGEYWAKRFADAHFGKNFSVNFSDNTSEHGWDLVVRKNSSKKAIHYIQVKTVSEWSKTRTMSPLHNPQVRPTKAPEKWQPWDLLWLMFLNRSFEPIGFWRLKATEVEFEGKTSLGQRKMRRPDETSGGSSCFQWPENEIHQFWKCVPKKVDGLPMELA